SFHERYLVCRVPVERKQEKNDHHLRPHSSTPSCIGGPHDQRWPALSDRPRRRCLETIAKSSSERMRDTHRRFHCCKQGNSTAIFALVGIASRPGDNSAKLRRS